MKCPEPNENAAHLEEMHENRYHWDAKPALRQVYRRFYRLILDQCSEKVEGPIVELGAGLGHFREVCPQCILTDIFANPWVDRVENAYRLHFESETVANLVLFDVFHHLQYPGTALAEFQRVLVPGGRVVILDPCISLLGFLVYGLLHHEPVSVLRNIEWHAPPGYDPATLPYYAAQGNASRIFYRHRYREMLKDWHVVKRERMSALDYLATGGYRGRQLCPTAWLPGVVKLNRLFSFLPNVFATRILVVLEKVGRS